MDKYVVANWKSHKSLQEAEKWFETFFNGYTPDNQVQIIVATSFIHIPHLWQIVKKTGAPNISLAAQDLSPFPLGAYTGAVAGEMMRDMVDYALVGHSERRRYFHETNQDVANKVNEAIAANITPVLCVDVSFAREQFAAINEFETDNLIIGYGPVEAIGINIPQSPEKVRSAVQKLQAMAPGKPVLYGGSINAHNAGNYSTLPGVSGLMAGSASLDAVEFAGICKSVSQS